MSILDEWIVLDTNIWIFGLRRVPDIPACAQLLERLVRQDWRRTFLRFSSPLIVQFYCLRSLMLHFFPLYSQCQSHPRLLTRHGH